MIPLALKLRKESHKKIAKAQDIIVETLYEVIDNAVIHGGTGIWRCYKGNRFSEDIDVYLKKDNEKISKLFEAFEKKGFFIEKKKITDNSIYSNLRLNDALVRFEAIFRKINGILKEYETSDGNLISVYTLAPEELVKEKISAFLNRRKIRDLYDIFFLLRFVQNKALVKPGINELAKNFKKPIDELDLKVLILEGIVPDSEKMLQYIKNWN